MSCMTTWIVADVALPKSPIDPKRTVMTPLPLSESNDQNCGPTMLSTVPVFSPGSSGAGCFGSSDCAAARLGNAAAETARATASAGTASRSSD